MSEISQQNSAASVARAFGLTALIERIPLRFHADLPQVERRFLGGLLGFILATGALLAIVTPVPFAALARGMSLYLFLPLVSVSVVWVVVRLAETLAGHRFIFSHARGQWMVATALSTSLAIPVYGVFKQFILKARGFPFDPLLAEVDRILFFGRDGWQVMHSLFGSVNATLFLDRAYSIWLPILMFCPVFWAAVVRDPILRARLVACWVGVWVFVGGAAAWLLASAGPIFYSHFIDQDPGFIALHNRIVELGALAKAQGDMLATPFGHVVLMQRYESGIYFPGFGISAMPSVHVSMAVMFAIGGFVVNKWLGWLFALYALIIWVGSVYLGWHYATDGLVGAALTIGLWKLSAKLAEPFEQRFTQPH